MGNLGGWKTARWCGVHGDEHTVVLRDCGILIALYGHCMYTFPVETCLAEYVTWEKICCDGQTKNWISPTKAGAVLEVNVCTRNVTFQVRLLIQKLLNVGFHITANDGIEFINCAWAVLCCTWQVVSKAVKCKFYCIYLLCEWGWHGRVHQTGNPHHLHWKWVWWGQVAVPGLVDLDHRLHPASLEWPVNVERQLICWGMHLYTGFEGVYGCGLIGTTVFWPRI